MSYLQRLISIFSSPSSSEPQLPNPWVAKLLQPGKHIDLGGRLYKMQQLQNGDESWILTPFIMPEGSVYVGKFPITDSTTIVLYAEDENHLNEFHEQLLKLSLVSPEQVSVSSNT